jgi:hypothetical protein
MIKFPSIEQFRNVIRHVQTRARYVGRDDAGNAVYDDAKPLPTLKFRGTVKLHGTNAGVVYDVASDSFTYQSRERVLSLTSDNAGFMLNMSPEEEIWRDIVRQAMTEIFVPEQPITNVAVFGEWCGHGIQKGVALTQLPKMFVVFAVKVVFADETTKWLPVGEFDIHYRNFNVYNIDSFPSWEIDIDFNHPEVAQNKMVGITEAVEAECPVGKHFGVSGIGEGVVWTCVSEGWLDSGTWFKVKGDKHSVSKTRTLAAVDVEAVESMRAFVAATVTEARLEQGLDNLVREQLKPFEITSIGDFIRWVYEDVVKEEQDTIVASGINAKKLGGAVANAARPWFIAKLNSQAGLDIG